jgi:hypothetical protein
MNVWPSYLPLPLLSGHGYAPGNGVIHSPMESGGSRSRRRFKNVPSKFSTKLLLNSQQVSLLDHFVEVVISGGADWFEMPVQLGTGLEVVDVKIIKLGKVLAKTRVFWNVSFELLIKSRPLISTETADFLPLINFSEFERIANYSETVWQL